MKKSGVYRILNLINGKSYIGSSKNLVKRMGEHRLRLRLGHHANAYLQAAWNKYGEDSFCFGIVEYCAEVDLESTEQRHIDAFGVFFENGCGYNLRPIAFTNKGVPASAHQRQVTRDRLTGVKNPKFSEALRTPERVAKSREQLNFMRRNPEVEAKRAAAIRKAYENPELREKQRIGSTGRRKSAEALRAQSVRVKDWQDERIAAGFVIPRDPKTGRIISTSTNGGTALSALMGGGQGGGAPA